MAGVYVLYPQKFMWHFYESNLGVSSNRFAGAITAQSRGADVLNANDYKGEAHSTFPMKDTPHCEEEGKKWMSTAIKEVRGNLKSYYCVTGYRINAGS